MRMKVGGYEFAPAKRLRREFSEYMKSAGWTEENRIPPRPATPVFADESGNSFVRNPSEFGPGVIPFIPGSPPIESEGSNPFESGGFVPADKLPSGPEAP